MRAPLLPDDPGPPANPAAATSGRRAGGICAGGAAALLLALPAVPGAVLLVAGQGHAVAVAVAGVIPAVTAAVVALYRARQDTQRRRLELHSTNVLADAIARAIDCVRATGPCDNPSSETEAADVRAAALRFLSESGPLIVRQLGSGRSQEETSEEVATSRGAGTMHASTAKTMS